MGSKLDFLEKKDCTVKSGDKHVQYQKLSLMVGKLMEEGYYGEITMKFEAGHVVFFKKTETLKL